MRKQLLLLTLIFNLTAFAQFEAIMEVDDNIKGLCNKNKVYALLEVLDGQKEAICPLAKTDILTRLNTEVVYIKNKPTTNDKGILSLMINCKGEVVQCQLDNKTKSPELDKQIEAVFNSLGDWKPGKLNGKEVDSVTLFSFKIVDGVFTFE